MRRALIAMLAGLLAAAPLPAASESPTRAKLEILNRIQIAGPPRPGDRAAWIEQMRFWRGEQAERFHYRGEVYRLPQLQWTRSAFLEPQMMVHDRFFYDAATGKYTVNCYLDDVRSRYGGIDAVLVWHPYPNIGIDDRNQFDLLRDLPGGVDGVRRMVADFHRHGVRVFFPVNPWDVGTRDEGVSMPDAMMRLLREVGADGMNGDTMPGVPRDYWEAAGRLGTTPALEPEGGMNHDDLRQLEWNTLAWVTTPDRKVPTVSKYRWFEPRHQEHVSERWAQDRTEGLQMAFFNGMGYMTWENVWGIWNGLTPRDAAAVRRIATLQRAVAPLLSSPNWEPHIPGTDPGVYASVFPGKGRAFYALISRADRDLPRARLQVRAGQRTIDLWQGRELTPAAVEEGQAVVRVPLKAVGFGAVLVLEDAALPGDVAALMKTMAELARTPLDSFSARWRPLPQQIVPIAPTRPAASAPPGMVHVPGSKKYRFRVAGVEIESLRFAGLLRDNEPDVGVDVQYPWESVPAREHDHRMEVRPFYIDKYPVTNADFKKFLDASRYRPRDDHNFLRDWRGETYPAGWADRPVTWVSLEDARAYAAWAHKRLPHEWEWQYAAQGDDGRPYPWGKQDNPAARPREQHGRTMLPPDEVTAHPQGASPFGVWDLVGNVWQWTDEFHDEHTRAAILRGGSSYRPEGALWYFPRNKTLEQHGKYLLLAPGLDRSAAVGFRCVVDSR